MKFNVKRVTPSGYCLGVINALKKVQETREKYPDQPIHVLGMIVHNRFVVEAFEKMGVVALFARDRSRSELLSEVKEGVIIFTAHGTSEALKKQAADQGLITVDATCQYVEKNMVLIKEYLNDCYEVIYIGKAGHPEAESVISYSEHIHLLTKEEELEILNIDNDRIMVTNQTTMSIHDCQKLYDAILARYPHAIIKEEICSATRLRQEAVMKLENTDLLIVVGDPQSNNTEQLVQTGLVSGIPKALKIEKAADLKDYDFSGIKNIAVTAGASTPRYLTDNVIKYLQTADEKYLNETAGQIL